MLKSNRNMKIKIRGVLHRSLPNARENERRIDWFVQNVFPCEGDDHAAWYVYKPGFLDRTSTAIAVVTLDCRSKRMYKEFQSRLQ